MFLLTYIKRVVGLSFINLFSSFFVFSQNLIPNPSFELNDSCGVSIHYIGNSLKFYCRNWFDDSNKTESSCDYFNECMPNILNVPNNNMGFSFAYDGNAYMGLSLMSFFDNNVNLTHYRETASVLLKETLLKDSTYCVQFYYKNSNIWNDDYGIDNLGILFTNDSLDYDSIRIYSPSVRTKKGDYLVNEEWTIFSGYYTAKGGEQYFHIGMFGDISETNYYYNGSGNPSNNFKAQYYYIDYVSVEMCDKDSVFSVVLDLPNVFTPNNDGINDFYEINYHNISFMDVRIFNRWGEEVINYDGLKQFWDGKTRSGEPVSDGVYFVIINAIDTFGESHQKSKTISIIR